MEEALSVHFLNQLKIKFSQAQRTKVKMWKSQFQTQIKLTLKINIVITAPMKNNYQEKI